MTTSERMRIRATAMTTHSSSFVRYEAKLRRLLRQIREDEAALERDSFSEEEQRDAQDDELTWVPNIGITANLSERQHRLASEVLDALARLRSGSFGTCTRCGGSVGTARLTAIPYAAHCIDCADSGRSTSAAGPSPWSGAAYRERTKTRSRRRPNHAVTARDED